MWLFMQDQITYILVPGSQPQAPTPADMQVASRKKITSYDCWPRDCRDTLSAEWKQEFVTVKPSLAH